MGHAFVAVDSPRGTNPRGARRNGVGIVEVGGVDARGSQDAGPCSGEIASPLHTGRIVFHPHASGSPRGQLGGNPRPFRKFCPERYFFLAGDCDQGQVGEEEKERVEKVTHYG